MDPLLSPLPDSEADQKLRQHVSDRMIAQQLEPPTDAEWLAKCARVREAQERLSAESVKAP